MVTAQRSGAIEFSTKRFDDGAWQHQPEIAILAEEWSVSH
jgi:hypothetical protein